MLVLKAAHHICSNIHNIWNMSTNYFDRVMTKILDLLDKTYEEFPNGNLQAANHLNSIVDLIIQIIKTDKADILFIDNQFATQTELLRTLQASSSQALRKHEPTVVSELSCHGSRTDKVVRATMPEHTTRPF